jgi:hypothetical protein
MQDDVEIRAKICQSHSHKAHPRSFLTKAAQPFYHTFISTYFVIFILESLALKMNGVSAGPDLELTLQDSKFFRAGKTTPSFKAIREIHCFHSLHSRQSSFQLHGAPSNTRTNL